MKLIGKNFLGSVSLMAMVGAFGAAPLTGAEALFPVAGEDGMAILFADADPDLAINWASTPASEYNGAPFATGGLTPEAGKLSFTGASLRMHYDSAGVLKFAGHNLVNQSQTLSSWGAASVTYVDNAIVAPDGTTTADRMVETAAVGAQHYGNISHVGLAGPKSFSIYAKAGERDWVYLYAEGGGKGKFFDVLNGTVGGNYVAAPTSASITSVGNGWFLCSITLVDTATNNFRVGITTGDGVISHDGDITKGVYLWGAKVQNLPVSDETYYPTTSSAVYRPRYDHNPLTPFAPRGLLVEEQRTNSLLHSQEFDNAAWTKGSTTVSANATTAPDGTSTADRIVEVAVNTSHTAHQSLASQATTTYSRYFKDDGGGRFIGFRIYNSASNYVLIVLNPTTGAVTLNSNVGATFSAVSVSVEDVGNGWFRVKITTTRISGTTIYTMNYYTSGTPTVDTNGDQAFLGDITKGMYHWGAQVEAGSFATSYIPTTTASVTRAADDIDMATSLVPFSTTVGSMLYRIETAADRGVDAFAPWSLNDGGSTEVIRALTAASNVQMRLVITDGGVAQTVLNVVYAVGGTNKFGGAWELNNSAHVKDGGTVATDAACTIPTVTNLQIGRHLTTSYLNGWIKSMVYLPRRMTDVQLQTATA